LVQLLPGQLPEDLVAVANRLAPALGVARLRVSPLEHLKLEVELVAEDPLTAVMPAPVACAPQAQIVIGINELGQTISSEPPKLTHIAVQGITGSGKSVWTYRLLTQLASYREALIAGLDPSGLLFRPFAGSKHAEWQVSGVGDPEAFAKLLRRLVDEMDYRIRHLPDDRDEVIITAERPIVFVVLEEIAGLYRVCDQHDKELGKLVRSLIGRLLAEGRKAGFRVLMIVQRAEAAVLGAFERAQCATRISFGVDSLESVRLLHPAAEISESKTHLAALPGVALLTAPGIPLMRFRAEYIGGYSQYCAGVIAACVQGG
jgi:S-DNA-T family DNA segregation ATPase FtsK/SpoIIIE